jgi:hypothetical protein
LSLSAGDPPGVLRGRSLQWIYRTRHPLGARVNRHFAKRVPRRPPRRCLAASRRTMRPGRGYSPRCAALDVRRIGPGVTGGMNRNRTRGLGHAPAHPRGTVKTEVPQGSRVRATQAPRYSAAYSFIPTPSEFGRDRGPLQGTLPYAATCQVPPHSGRARARRCARRGPAPADSSMPVPWERQIILHEDDERTVASEGFSPVHCGGPHVERGKCGARPGSHAGHHRAARGCCSATDPRGQVS